MIDSNLICHIDSTLLTAMELINKNSKGIIFIVDHVQKLCGALTDGDIRRALLNGVNLQDKVSLAMNQECMYCFENESKQDMLNKIDYRIKIIPIVDKDLHVVDYFEFANKVRIPVAEPALDGNEFSYAIDAILSTWISSNGKYITKFEENFSAYCECNYGVATSNGTTALHLALLALGIGKGDEVIVPDLTFAASINTVLHVQATPVIVDIEEESWCIDPIEIEKAITPKTKAIMPVHIYGQPCDMGKIMDIAKRHNLFVIEDCAEAHGAEFGGHKVGSFGDISCFSFFANKIITTGEGGMCVTNSIELNDKMRLLRDHGMSKRTKYWHEVVGYNYRMTNIQAAIGLAQLERIDDLISKRDIVENKYNEILADINGIKMQKRDLEDRRKVNWLIGVLFDQEKREKILTILSENGIEVRPFFYPLSCMEIYKQYMFSNENSVKISASGINLPTSIKIEHDVIEKIKKILMTIL